MIRWTKPRLKLQNGRWYVVLPTSYSWSWYVGSGVTIREVWETFEQAKLIANMMNNRV